MTPKLRKAGVLSTQVFGMTKISKCGIYRIEPEPEGANADERSFRKSTQLSQPVHWAHWTGWLGYE